MRMLRLLPLLVLTLLPACASPQHPDPYAGGCVAADHELASRAGAEILAKGGNAVDAAVATSFALSVVRPYSCGIGGGGFMVIHLSDEGLAAQRSRGRDVPRSTAINYREIAPAAAMPDRYENDPDPHASTRGGKAVAIPGTVAGLLHALDTYGTLDRATVLAPAIRAAEQGFEADAHYATAARGLAEDFERYPDWKTRFAFVWTRFLHEGRVQAGDRIHIPEQARVLRLIAEQGAPGFYAGEVGSAIARAVNADRGDLTAADLARFRVSETQPLTRTIFGHTFLTMPPPSSGGLALLEMLLVFESLHAPAPEFDQFSLQPASNLIDGIGNAFGQAWIHGLTIEAHRTSAAFLHPLIESSKHAFADRARYLADPAFVHIPTDAILGDAPSFRARYNPEHTLPPEHYGTPGLPSHTLPDDHGTSHFCVVDAHGSAVSCTETINLEFGSLVAVPEFGFVLNNEMDDFTTRRGQANAFGLIQSDLNLPAPGKRPLSSMTPTIVLDNAGRVQVVAGGSGGPRIISATAQCILGALFNPIFGSQEILAARRIHHQWNPDVVYVESDPPESTISIHHIDPESLAQAHRECGREIPNLYAAIKSAQSLESDLRARGHTVQTRRHIAEVQIIRRRENTFWDPASDPRKGGKPAGVPR